MEATGKAKKGAACRKEGGPRKKAVTRSIRADLQFPVGRIGRYLKNDRYAKRVGTGAPVYLVVVLEYLAAEGFYVVIWGFYSGMIAKLGFLFCNLELLVWNDCKLGFPCKFGDVTLE
ncbi:putative transcription factor Hap3/NF-YB family [Helianthus anomalus]